MGRVSECHWRIKVHAAGVNDDIGDPVRGDSLTRVNVFCRGDHKSDQMSTIASRGAGSGRLQGFDTGFSGGIVAAPEVKPDGCSVFLPLN